MAEQSEEIVEITRPGIVALGTGLPSAADTATLFADRTVAQISCGPNHSAVVLTSGRVYVFGKYQDNGWAEPDENVISPPMLVTSLSHVKVVQAACGKQFTLFLTDRGQVYACGRNENGQLGLERSKVNPVPELLDGLPRIRKVAAGYQHSLVLTENGEVWWAGSNNLSINGTPLPVTTQRDRRRAFSQVAQQNVHLYQQLFLEQAAPISTGATKNNSKHTFVHISMPSYVIIDIACGDNHSALLTETRVVLVADGNSQQQGRQQNCVEFKPISNPTAAIIAVSCGWRHTVCNRRDGSVWAWGDDAHGQLGNGKLPQNTSNQPTSVAGLDGYSISQVFAGHNHTALVTSDGDVLVCGRGISGELGQKKQDISKPTLLKKSPELVVKRVAFAETYSLILVGTKELEIAKEESLPKEIKTGVTDVEERIIKSLECPVCYKVMLAPINQCSNGHSVCASCRAATPHCSLCRQPYTNSRNFNLETLSTVLPLPCADCLERMTVDLLERHSKVCPSRKYNCPLQQSCDWRGRPEDMHSHTSSAHPQQTWQQLPHMFVLSLTARNTSCTYLLYAHSQVFTLHLKYDKKLQVFARYIGPSENANEFRVRIALIKTDDSEQNMYVRNVFADTENIDHLFNSSSCLSLSRETLSSYSHLHNLVCEVDILKSGNRKSYIEDLLQNVVL